VSEAPAAGPPSLAEAIGWMGFDVDDVHGSRVGRVDGLYVDAERGEPVWLVVTIGRRRRARKTVMPAHECAGGGGRVWVAQPRQALRDAPTVDPNRQLLREHEVTICTHYGIGAAVGRHAEVATRSQGAVTAQPA
jgi:Bacterial transcriptional activator domain